MSGSKRAGFHELPFRADDQVADAVFPNTLFRLVVLMKFGPLLHLPAESDANLNTASQTVGQTEREIPMLAVGIVFVGGADLELELSGIHRVRVVNG
jgi:hypothetical protein